MNPSFSLTRCLQRGAITMGLLLSLASLSMAQGLETTVQFDGANWQVKRGTSSVYTGTQYVGALRAAMASLTPGRTWKETVRIMNDGKTGAYNTGIGTEIRIPSWTILEFGGNTLDINDTGTGGNFIPFRLTRVEQIEIRNAKLVGNPRYFLKINSSRNVVLQQLHIQGRNSTNAIGVRIDDFDGYRSANVRIDRIRIQNVGSHGIETAGLDSLYIGTIETHSTGGCGLLLQRTVHARIDSVLADSAAHGGGYAGLRLANNAGPDIDVKYVRTRWCGRGIFMLTGSKGIRIQKVDIDNSSNHGILIENTRDVRIEGGVVRNSGDGPNTVEGVYVSTRGTSLAEGLHPSNNVSIRNLRIYDDRATPYQFYGLRENCTNGIYAMDSNSFVNNDLRGNQRPLTIQVNGGGIPGCPNTLANGNILNGDITPRPWLTTQTPIATAPTRVLLRSGIDGPDATIKKMELLRNGQILTSRTSAPWLFSVTAPTSGVVAYQVRATDYMGYTSTSNALRISTSPLPANKAPTISLTSSATTATTPANLTFTANPSDVDGRIVRVELYRNGTFLASRTSAPWQFSFNNLALSGTNNFVARAIDDDSAVSVSPTVSVVLGSPYRFEARPSSFVDSTWVRYQLPSNWAAVPVHLVLRRVGSATPIQTTLDVQAKPGDNSRYWRAPKTMARGYYYLTLMMDGVAKASILLVRL